MKNPLIYIVDTNISQGNLLRYRLLSRSFSNIQVFSSQEECLSRMQRDHIPDFIISEPGMDPMKGLKFLRLIREINTSIKVIFYTSEDDEILAETFINAGAADYILKTNNSDSGFNELMRNMKYMVRTESFYP